MVEDPAAPLVEGFLKGIDRIRDALLREYPEFERLDVVLQAVRSGDLARKAQTVDGFIYSVHGRGCLFIGPDGMEVDIDLLPGGWEAFDLWRLKRFAESVGVIPAPQEPVLLRECQELLRTGVLCEPQEGWYSSLRGEHGSRPD